MKIDVHAHYWSSKYLDLHAEMGSSKTHMHRGAGEGEELTARLELMKRAGVDMQVLSACPLMPYFQDKENAVLAARLINDEYAALVESDPNHFRAFASLPLPHIEESISEIARSLDELGMAGICVNTTILDIPLVDPQFEPIFAELDRRKAILYIHPAGNGCCSPLITDHKLTWQIGAPIEDTISAMHLIASGIPTRFPNIRIINSHLGGALSVFMKRVDNLVDWEAPDTPEKPSVTAKRMWYDTVGHAHLPALRAAIETFGADRLILGTDYPYENGDLFVRAIDYISDSSISSENTELILEKNATSLFGLDTVDEV